jgi:Fe-S-cluster containining protein
LLISAKTPLKDVIKYGAVADKKLEKKKIPPEKRGIENCDFGSGFCHEKDLPKLAAFLRVSVDDLKEKYLEEVDKFNTKRYRPKVMRKEGMPYGQCIFLDKEKGCTVHQVRPLQCRVAHTDENSEALAKWFDFNYFVNRNDPESIRQYALWLQFNEPLPGAEIESIVQDKELLNKILNYEVMK